MRPNHLRLIAATFALALFSPAQAPSAPASQDDFFGLQKLWTIHLTVARDDWTQMFPVRGDRQSMLRMNGTFPYHKGDVAIGSSVLKGIGVRFKGNSTFSSTNGTLKRSFKLDFNRHDRTGNFLGLLKLNLHCNALDGTQIKDGSSYQLYRDAGVHAPRVCYARVYLTIPGEVERTYLGLYTVVEQIDSVFAKRTVGGGLIMKPEGETLAYRGDKWNEDYERLYVPKSTATEEMARPVIELARLFKEKEGDALADAVEEVLDVESFLRYTAVSTVLVNTDSPLVLSHNYYLIVPKKTKKVVWVPWDLNLSLGGFSRMLGGGPDMSIMNPSRVPVFTKMLAIPRFKKRYREIIAEIIEGPCSGKAMAAVVKQAHETARDAIAEEATRIEAVTRASEELGGRARRGFGSFSGFGRQRADDVAALQEFLKEREQSVKDQLAGKSEGRTMGGFFGGGGGGGDRGGFGRTATRSSQVRDMLSGTGALDASLETYSKEDLRVAVQAGFESTDADRSGTVDKAEITAPLRRYLKATRGSSKIGRFDLAGSRARTALGDLDGDDDGSVTRDEWQAAFDKLLPAWDADNNGVWTKKELKVVNVPKADGWVNLFDGKTLDGWTQRNGTAKYTVSDGTIVGTTNEGSPNSFLCTNRDYSDFELVFDVKVHDRLNSGVQIRSRTRGGPQGRVNGPQVEIEASGANGAQAGYIYGEAAGGWMTPNNIRKPHKHLKDGEWNAYRVLAVGNNIKVWINGTLISDLTHEKRYQSHPRGFIGLQVHGIGRNQGPYDVRWRNIRLRELRGEDAGWKRLYNRKDLSGWKTDGNWLPQTDGSLMIEPRSGEKGWQRFGAYLWSEKKYKDFILDVEYSYPKGGNSGVFFRVGDLKSPVNTGIECQILDSTGKKGAMTHHDHGGIISTVGASANMSKPAGEWNRMIVMCRGHHLRVDLNGQAIIDVMLDKSAVKDRPGEGHVGLQDHGEPHVIRFRNVLLKEL
ncbi:MAG: DUF1080 domain-containing protein [Planctomycetes bacterium]|nr:DUF1080 domain-containing protein [Planctomycetota bacterium]